MSIDTADQVDTVCHHTGRYAEGYCFAFRRGAKDALRRAARRLPAEMRAILEQLSDEYEHAPR